MIVLLYCQSLFLPVMILTTEMCSYRHLSFSIVCPRFISSSAKEGHTLLSKHIASVELEESLSMPACSSRPHGEPNRSSSTTGRWKLRSVLPVKGIPRNNAGSAGLSVLCVLSLLTVTSIKQTDRYAEVQIHQIYRST